MLSSFTIAFLVYDSRSGSTILAKTLNDRFQGLHVTPEFDLSGMLEGRHVRGMRLQPQLDDRSVANLSVDGDRLHAIVADGRLDGAERLRRTLSLYRATRHDPASPEGNIDTILVKSGTHLRHVAALRATLGDDTRFVFLHRDPRDVIASKLHTRRPYVPDEVMAWGGALLAALRWTQYARAAERAQHCGASVHAVSYADFVNDPDAVCREVARFLGAALRCEKSRVPNTTGYTVPQAEQAIHAGSVDGRVDAARARYNRESLSRRQDIVIDAVCGPAMQRLGYARRTPVGRLSELMALLVSAAESALLIGRHARRRLPVIGHR